MSNNKQTITELIRNYILFSTLMVVILIVLTSMLVAYLSYVNIVETESEFFHNDQKELIRNEVHRAIHLIEEQTKEWETNYKQEITLKTSQAWELATSILLQQKAHHSAKESKMMIEEALRSIDFFDQGGFYADQITTDKWLISIGGEQHRISLSNLKSKDTVTAHQIESLLMQGEGFYTGLHPFKTNQNNKPVKSTFYVKRIPSTNMFICMGNDSTTLTHQLQSDVLNKLAKIRYGKNYQHYIFVNQLDGRSLLIHSTTHQAGDYINDILDPDSIPIFKIEKEAALQENGGYIKYKWFQPHLNSYSDNISFVQLYQPWNWIVGAHSNLAYVDEILQRQKATLKEKLTYVIWIDLLILLIAVIVIQLYMHQLNRTIKLQVTSLLRNIGNAIQKNSTLPDKEYLFAEFCEINQHIKKIIKQKQFSEKQYQISKNHFETIYKNAPVMISGLDENRKFVLWNKECERIFGISLNALNKHPNPVSLFYNQQDADQVKSLLSHPDGVFRLLEVKAPNNKKRYQYWAAFKTDDNWIINVGYDITALKTSELKWNEQSLFLKSLIKSIPNPVFFKDADGIYQFGNKEFARLIGKREDEIKGLTVYDISPPDLANKYKEMDAALLKEGGVQSYEFTVEDAENGPQFYLFNKAVYENLEGKATGIIGVMLNITGRKQAEIAQAERQEILEEMNRTKNRFLSIVAHDLKTPLHAILGFTDILINAYDNYDDIERKKLIEATHFSAHNLDSFLMSLLTWVQSQLRDTKLILKSTHLRETVEHEINLLKENISAKEITVENNITSNIYIKAEEIMISTVIRNLIANAIKFSHRKGRIQINAQLRKNDVIIEVKDEGIGIRKESQEQLFAADVKTSTAGTESEKGTGLGLLICKEFIEKHQGEIWVESEPNAGSAFFFSLPLEPSDASS